MFLILLGILIVFLWATSIKLPVGDIPEKAPSGFMKSFGRRIGIKSIPVNDIPIIHEKFLASGYQIRLAIRRNEVFCTYPLFDGKAIPLHYQIEFWKFSGRRIIWRAGHSILALKKTLPSRYRNDFGWRPALIKSLSANNC